MSNQSNWHQLYNLKRWKQLRLDHLAQSPLCIYCLRNNQYTPATVVDHIKPHKGNLALFFDPSNLQSLCKSHHDSAKQKAEINNVNEIGCDINGFPLDWQHPFHQRRGG